MRCFSLFFFLIVSQLSSAQADSVSWIPYGIGFEFNEGVYLSFDDFKNNNPTIRREIIKKGNIIYLEYSSDSIAILRPNNVWGYSVRGNVYISSENEFWRCINIGRLTQFTAIALNSYRTVDTYGFYNEVQTTSLQQSFLDMNDGLIKKMNYQNMKPFIDEEPSLSRYIKNNRRAKYKELILVLRAYNKLNPLYFPVYE